jgi:hypothetical protein
VAYGRTDRAVSYGAGAGVEHVYTIRSTAKYDVIYKLSPELKLSLVSTAETLERNPLR